MDKETAKIFDTIDIYYQQQFISDSLAREAAGVGVVALGIRTQDGMMAPRVTDNYDNHMSLEFWRTRAGLEDAEPTTPEA